MMAQNRLGSQTIVFPSPPAILSCACAVSKKENEGPLRGLFDIVMDDPLCGKESYEQAESAMLLSACEKCLEKAGVTPGQTQVMLGGDLLNQIMAASMAARSLHTPFLGLYGACSTMSESLLLGAVMVSGGFGDPVLCAAGSHYCTAERQYRFPLEYASQRTPASQRTVTGAGAALLSASGDVRITHAAIGRVTDLGVSDANNMGAAMAPAAAATLRALFADTGSAPSDYDQIITGDLGMVGSSLLKQLMREEGIELGDDRYMDCGLTIYSPDQDVRAGGSGCGCAASVLCAYILPRLREGAWKKVIFMATGALLSPTFNQQGETIPGVAHALVLTGGGK